MEHPRHGDGLERDEREPRHQVEVQADQAEQAVLGFSALPLAVPHVDLHGVDRELLGQRGDEGRALRGLVDDVDDVPPIAPQHAAVVVQGQPRDPVRYPVDDPGGRLAEKTVPALDAHYSVLRGAKGG